MDRVNKEEIKVLEDKIFNFNLSKTIGGKMAEWAIKENEAIEHLLQAYKQQQDIIKNSVSKDKIIQLKDFIINDCTQNNIDLIPLSNFIENINILLEGDE